MNEVMEVVNNIQLLVKFKDNWADEIDICGCAVMSEEEWYKYVTIAKDYFDSMDKIDFNKVTDDDDWLSDVSTLSFVIGSNEWIEYESFDELMNCFTISVLTDEQAEFLKANGFERYGFFPDDIFDEWIGYKEYH